ncbi:MAG: flagellar motor protein MotB [Deltaproteobacteria bacterium]|nr:flagellar motor protein MotB [Deltaproteobacteria bacterium]
MTEQKEHSLEALSPPDSRENPIERMPALSGITGYAPGGDTLLFKDSLFAMDKTSFGSSLPKVSHWSVAWSDLMMTMFILFLSMFIYQAAHKEFLVSDEVEVLGGETSEALEVGDRNQAVFPFVPIKPAPPLMTSGTIKKVEPIHLQDIDVDTAFFDADKTGGKKRIIDSLNQQATTDADEVLQVSKIDRQTMTLEKESSRFAQPSSNYPSLGELEQNEFSENFILEKEALVNLDLDKFASIDLVPDTAMRIILTGDLLFDTGMAELSFLAKNSLRKIADIIKRTPYIINVVGHTDNIPMNSDKYATNWELSVARASRVTRFLIEDMNMNPNQFVVSGYGPYRPIKSNTNSRNRAVNRRVEIIISKKLPAPVAATAENIN